MDVRSGGIERQAEDQNHLGQFENPDLSDSLHQINYEIYQYPLVRAHQIHILAHSHLSHLAHINTLAQIHLTIIPQQDTQNLIHVGAI